MRAAVEAKKQVICHRASRDACAQLVQLGHDRRYRNGACRYGSGCTLQAGASIGAWPMHLSCDLPIWKETLQMDGPGAMHQYLARKMVSLARLAAVLVLAGCTNTLPAASEPPAGGPARTSIAVVQGDWHTDICLRMEDANAWVASLAHGFEGAKALCFGFGERRYMLDERHDPLTMIGALLPSEATVQMTVLRATPEIAFGAQNVVEVPVDDAGLAGLQDYLRESLETDATGAPRRLASWPHEGSVFFAASAAYDGLHTCNTWTARALRSAGLTGVPDTLFAGSLMNEVRRALEKR
jgi:uncharacterized protein (TIGR02117 family)